MRAAIAILLFTVAVPFIDDAKAQQRWCAITNEGATNCSFVSISQCRDEVSGMGGNCMPEAPVGHRQPTPSGKRGPLPKDDLDKAVERASKRDDKIQLCRGC